MANSGRSQRAALHEMAPLGIAMGGALALFAWGGDKLDERLGTAPLFVLVGVFVAFGASLLSLYARLAKRGESEGSGSDD